MRIFVSVFFTLIIISFLACDHKEMELDSYLKNHSTRFDINKVKNSPDNALTFGHFSSYDKEFGLAWMQTTGIDSFFNASQLYTFSVDNNSNYVYDIVASPISEGEKLFSYAQNYLLPLDSVNTFSRAYIGYLYAPHDEYAMIYIQYSENQVKGYLSNGFDQYEIFPVESPIAESTGNKGELLGYQIKLNGDYVGSLQTNPMAIFRMSTEFCDATEMILASIASTLIKCENL